MVSEDQELNKLNRMLRLKLLHTIASVCHIYMFSAQTRRKLISKKQLLTNKPHFKNCRAE